MRKLYFFSLLIFAIACTNNQGNQTSETPESNPTTATTAPTTVTQPAEPPAPAAPALPTGKLVSTDDPMSSIEFKDGNFIETYGKDVLGTYVYNFDPGCENCKDAFEEGTSAGDGHVGCFKYSDGGETYSFIIYSMSSDKIEYSMIGGRGNTLSYVRR